MIRPYKARAVITGLGVVAPNGIGKEAFWSSLVEGRSGIGPITLFDAKDHACRIAGEVKDFDPRRHIAPDFRTRRFARHTQFALAAAKMAISDSGVLDREDAFSGPLPVALGVSSSAFEMVEHGAEQLRRRGPEAVTPYVVNSSPPQAATAALSHLFQRPVEGLTVSTGCSAGLDAIGSAVELVRSGRAEVVLAGGTDAPITPLAFATFVSAGLASVRNENPETASRPFDRNRDSGVVSEGAGIVVIENIENARARGGHIYAEITGAGSNLDPDGDTPAVGLADTMRMALANAGKGPADVDYICAHGPGHPVLDRSETAEIKEVFGNLAYRIPVSSIKGVTGNPLSAAGPLQLIACALAFENNTLPPTANHTEPDEGCDLDYIPGAARNNAIECALINVHGIGGANSSLVVERVR